VPGTAAAGLEVQLVNAGKATIMMQRGHSSDSARGLTPTADTNGVGPLDPLSDVCALFPQVGGYIGHLYDIF
jgi:hypothetical protein